MGNFIDPALVDPNLIYLALIAGLWVGVTAVYMAGTGIPEILSIVLTGGSLLILTQLPTNWLAVILMVEGKGNYFLKVTGPQKTVAGVVDAFRTSFGADKEKEVDYELSN